MRCLYCGIKLKIAEKAKKIEHCPECSERIEYEGRREALLCAEDRSRSLQASSNRHFVATAAMKSA
jgi:DNA-directed RNA polymerase subunit RPC12/RpoP